MRLTFVLASFLIFASAAVSQSELHFTRLKYRGIYGDDNLKNWYTDYPEMDEHLVSMLNRVTRIRANHTLVQPSHLALFEFPFIYTVEPEQMNLSEFDVRQLREFLARGGFWLMDDFHGDEDWGPTMQTIQRILPGARPVELHVDHALFHCFFDIPEVKAVVMINLAMCTHCLQYENGPSGRVPKVFAIFDAYGRIMILMSFNTDLGDGMEWADDPAYPLAMSAYSFRFFANTLIYAMSH